VIGMCEECEVVGRCDCECNAMKRGVDERLRCIVCGHIVEFDWEILDEVE